MSGKITKAQAKFLAQLAQKAGAFRPGFDLDVLRGPETAMAERLEALGLTHRPFGIRRGKYWDITPAGLSALNQPPPQVKP